MYVPKSCLSPFLEFPQVDTDFAYREFLITPITQSRRASTPTDSSSRRVVQLQYISWPDHGVPGNADDLITFVDRVREARGLNSRVPIVVHCSAGIGRTGVLITIETALNLMERDQPVRPIELVQLMRAQRALLIQTTVSFLSSRRICFEDSNGDSHNCHYYNYCCNCNAELLPPTLVCT